MTVKDFIKKYYPYALETQTKTGISAIAILAQSAIETGWGEKCPGNMMFGIKDTDGLNGHEQLITTTEYHSTAGVKYPEVISIKPVTYSGKKMFKYTVKDYFKKYNSPEESFTDHANFFKNNKRYSKALLVKDDPIKFAIEIALAGYATGPGYAALWVDVIKTVQKHIK